VAFGGGGCGGGGRVVVVEMSGVEDGLGYLQWSSGVSVQKRIATRPIGEIVRTYLDLRAT
jgi:hypothetical protein